VAAVVHNNAPQLLLWGSRVPIMMQLRHALHCGTTISQDLRILTTLASLNVPPSAAPSTTHDAVLHTLDNLYVVISPFRKITPRGCTE
jgi:hypothetical protein